jgi:hypothetical protein
MCGIMSLFRQFEPTEPKLPINPPIELSEDEPLLLSISQYAATDELSEGPPTAPSTPKSNTAHFRQFVSLVTRCKSFASNAKRDAQQRIDKRKATFILRGMHDHTVREAEEADKAKTKATLIQKRVRGMLVRMKEQKKKKISTKTVDQLMLRRFGAKSLLGAEQEDTLIGKISTKKISTKTVDQLMLRRLGAKSLLGTVPVKSKHSRIEHSRIEEVDRLMRLRPETPALVALGKSGGIRRNIAKIDSMMAKIKKTPDNDVRSRFSTGQSVVLWKNNRWVPRTIVGSTDEGKVWKLRSQIPELLGDQSGVNTHINDTFANDDDLMPMTYVEESLASILKRKLDEINETMERIGAKQIEAFRLTMETISKVIRKTMTEEHDEIWTRFQTSLLSLEARLDQIRAAALNHNPLMYQ